MGNWKVAFIPYFTNEPKEALSVLSSLGYDGVEWVRYLHFMTADDLKSLKAQTTAAGMEICDVMGGIDVVTPKDEARAERVRFVVDCIDAARDAGVGIVNLTTGPAEWGTESLKLGKDIAEGKAWELVIDSFTKIVEAAEKNGVTITVEAAFNMVVRDYYTMHEFLGHFDSKNLAVNMDPSHLALVGNDVPWVVRRLGNKIKHVHAKDVFGKPGSVNQEFMFPMLGEGVIDWKAFFKALKEIGYDGYLSIEFEAENYLKSVWGGDWKQAAKTSKEQLDALVKLAEVA